MAVICCKTREVVEDRLYITQRQKWLLLPLCNGNSILSISMALCDKSLMCNNPPPPFFIAMQGLSSLNLMNCTCYVVTSPSILCTLWKPGLMTLCRTMNSLSPVTLLVVEDCCTLEICHTMPCLWITWNCHCTMVVATAFVSVHCTVCLPPLPLFCNV